MKSLVLFALLLSFCTALTAKEVKIRKKAKTHLAELENKLYVCQANMRDQELILTDMRFISSSLSLIARENIDKLAVCENRTQTDANTIKALTDQIAGNQDTVSSLNKRIEYLEAQVKLKSNALKQTQLKIEGLEANLTTSGAIIRESKLKINQLEAELALDSDTIKTRNTEIEQLKSTTNRSASQMEEMQNRIQMYEAYCLAENCQSFTNSTGIRTLKIPDMEPFLVPCDSQLAGEGWTVVQRRIDGSVSFERNWAEYQAGFGNINGEFFIGLERLHRLTVNHPQEFYVLLEDWRLESRYAHYDHIVIGNETEQYELKILGNYSGNAGDALLDNRNQKFSTYDRDNDQTKWFNCAEQLYGAWWYNACSQSNLNGRYLESNTTDSIGIFWNSWHGSHYSFKTVQLLIRPKSG